ncbi:hypothetical protein [Reinekea sp.]|jgi:hypothetical protein|uniref:hypothetical protein n=1 Tax=Reinekea sp. TaxID=1970455 RepID=UPI002A83CF37|nr:hypothetical protein [Reinekea sp.]
MANHLSYRLLIETPKLGHFRIASCTSTAVPQTHTVGVQAGVWALMQGWDDPSDNVARIIHLSNSLQIFNVEGFKTDQG